jgi:hypothetical protein
LGISYGVEVIDLKDGKLKAAGFKNGFVILTANDTRISSSSDLTRVVQSIMKQDPDNRGLYLRIFNPNSKSVQYIAIDLNE